jgi:hypothetical protein
MINYYDKDVVLYFPNGRSLLFSETTKAEQKNGILEFSQQGIPYYFRMNMLAGYACFNHRESADTRWHQDGSPFPTMYERGFD